MSPITYGGTPANLIRKKSVGTHIKKYNMFIIHP